MNRDTTGEGSVSNQEERDSPIFCGNNQGPVVMVWDGMLPGEQQSAKKIITDKKDWIICRVKPNEVTWESKWERTGNPRRPLTFSNGMGQD
jgi:hypothetical protein